MPILLGCGILWWMYRNFDFGSIATTLLHETNWWWMAFSLVFGVTAQLFRGLRWTQLLTPIGEQPRRSTCIHAVFMSYAASLIIPRIGEATRCGVLAKYDGVSFSKALGTVITERIIDSALILVTIICVGLSQLKVFVDFFAETGTNIDKWISTFTPTGWAVTIVCVLITIAFIWIVLKRLTFSSRISKIITDLKAGIGSLRNVKNKPLFALYTLGIWGSYFLHYYITFFCFDYTADLGIDVALVSFVVGTVAVIVPTPNGMGSWHFAVKTILVLYGVEPTCAETFVLIVHTIQTALVPILGIYSSACLSFEKSKNELSTKNT